ncbi:hypothetical protein BH20ACI1_BH20ACI1_05250 [soil metagenome]
MNAPKPEKLTCESCGKGFFCGANIGKCWCFEVEVDKKTLAQLREDYKNCLCNDCLHKLQFEEKIL